MAITPVFQAQNPAISGYALGWSSCTAFAAAMAASFDQQVAKLCTGRDVRVLCHDTTGGLKLQQIDAALLEYDVNLNTVLGDTFANMERRVDEGQGAVVQLWYAPVADSPFDAGRGFRKNHAIFLPPGWGAMDPMADGRYGEAYKYRGEAYPHELIREATGELNIGTASRYKPLGIGKVYVSYTHDRIKAYRAAVKKGQPFGLYAVDRNTRTTVKHPAPHAAMATGDWEWSCTAPALYRWPGHSSRSLVVLTSGALAAKAKALGVSFAIPSSFARVA